MTDEQIIAAAGDPVAVVVEAYQDNEIFCPIRPEFIGAPLPVGDNLYTADAILAAAKPLRDRIADLEANASTMKAYYEQVFEDGGKRIAEITNQRDQLLDALTKIAETNASKHGTTGMMLERCTEIARSAIAAHKTGGAA